MFIELFIIALFAGITPGPDLFVVIKNSLSYGVRIGLATALGIAASNVVHISLTIIGISVLVDQYPSLNTGIKIIGALYIVWIGINAIQSSPSKGEKNEDQDKQKELKPFFKAFREGFLISVFNVKPLLFFVSIFSQFIDPETGTQIRWLYGLEMVLTVGLLFSTIAVIASTFIFRKYYNKYAYWIDRIFGIVLILFAITIVFSVF
ncbi:LysE family translocator [Chengkuizengella axinellae]|uniref:LysE family translocator n=1 Tax=Chengkuizengella axinellae TaxID=3064388 RepID=A0ABT9IYK3_9BACL|nr:LysE family translocator [Chengkuizengella sp. 2205SS18-9]MDP5273884.1 LysE family translocator [Chengkuizengella sp. 2205SS18-9]